MIFVKPVPILVPASSLFGLVVPSCFNRISDEAEHVFLICPFRENDPSLIAVEPETFEHRDRLVKLFIGENGLYALPRFDGSDFGSWTPGGAYILLPLDYLPEYCGCGYKFKISNTAVPLYDRWEYAREPEEFPWPFK